MCFRHTFLDGMYHLTTTEHTPKPTVYTFALVNCKSFVIFTRRFTATKTKQRTWKTLPNCKSLPS
ncbi:hypothetical protein L21SP5_00456 [Salinivirga cyanobacteriivorans]|uniref:Uncharacterized protein n=1 Tax=Salinivirga cyanobacteriivorans TaxID=1307839 RepID=A0A0S2HVR0_9BACT|nr:hypothetical protein L21SP5_00456 [Salinivirga cyanobacteriivorans]